MIDRRAFITTLTLTLLSTPLAAEAQQAVKVYRVGTLTIGFRDPTQPDWWQPFIDAMRELGYVEGRKLILALLLALIVALLIALHANTGD